MMRLLPLAKGDWRAVTAIEKGNVVEAHATSAVAAAGGLFHGGDDQPTDDSVGPPTGS